MMWNRLMGLARLSGAVGLTGLAVAACGGATPAGGGAGQGLACADQPASTARTPLVAYLDESGAPATAANTATLNTVLDGAKAMGADFVLNAVGQGVGAPNLVVNTVMAPEGPNELFRKVSIGCKTSAAQAAATKVAGDQGGRDDVSAFKALHDDLETIPHGEVNVVLRGTALDRTALNATQALDLAHSGTLANPARAINALAEAGLNFSCAGWRVTMVGGSLDPDGRPLTPGQDAGLQAFWRLYFEHCGGALVAYSTQIAQYPVSGITIQAADYQTIPIKIVRRPHLIIATLNSSVLFTTGSATLLPQADQGLQKLLPLLAKATRVEIAGYTDNTGTNAINQPLSKGRAGTVRSWILANSSIPASRIAAIGYGATRPVATNATAAGRAQNRRVVLTMHVA
jgi:outer membrane protein OmpA-like peptidoglycan-associated protein